MEKSFLLLGKESSLSLGQVIRELRTRRGLSSRSMSQSCGVSAAYISKLENGSITPSAKILVRILVELDCSPSEILYIFGILSRDSDEV